MKNVWNALVQSMRRDFLLMLTGIRGFLQTYAKVIVAVILLIAVIYFIYLVKIFAFDPLNQRVSEFPIWYYAIMPVLGLLFMLAVIYIKYRQRLPVAPWLYAWVTGNAIAVILGYGFLLLLPLIYGSRDNPYSFRNWWWSKITTPQAVFIIIGFVLFSCMMASNMNRPHRWTLAKWGIGILAIASILWLSGFGNGTLPENSSHKMASYASKDCLSDADTKNLVNKFWFSHYSIDDAREMVNIAQAESGFKQFNADCSVFKGKNPKDVGVMQINEDAWIKKSEQLGHNIYTLEGNLDMALYIRKEKGVEEWTSLKVVKTTTDNVQNFIAPVGIWSEIHKVTPGSNCMWKIDRVILLQDDKENVYRFDTKEPLSIKTTEFRIQAPDEPQGTMEYTCR